MPRRNTIEVIINATDNASGVMLGFADNTAKLGGMITTAFAGAVTAVGAATAAMVTKGLSEFTRFETGMNEVFTLLPGITQDAMDDMSSQVQAFSARMGILSEDVVPALYQSISAGVPQDNVFQFLEVAQKAAVGGVTDLETAVDGISSVINAYGTEVLDAAQASDLMFTAVRLGKCVVGETRVLLADGRYKRIDELQDGGTIVAYDGRNFVPMKATWVDQGVKPTVTVRTRLGREIVTTWNHPYLSIPKEQDHRSNKKPEWRKVSDLKVGDKIAVPTSLPYFGDVEVPEHESGLLGLWLAEGNANAASPRITTTLYEDKIREWANEWECFSVRNVEKREGKAPQYLISNGAGNTPNPIMTWLRTMGLGEGSSETKHIPDVVFTWERKAIANLLHWLFNGDGWLADLRTKGRSGFQLGFCSKSERLVRDISHLLLRFGIVGRVRYRKESNAWVWEINRHAEIERFIDLIGIDRDTAELVHTHAPEKQKAMWGVVEYDPIVEIIAGDEQHVYDLCVEELHNFVANDIVAHNTDFSQLSASLFNVVPVAASMGIGFENVTAALAALTAQGVPTSVATTQLRAAFVELADSGSDVGKAFTEVAGESFRDFIAGGGDLAEALDLVSQAAEASGTPIDELFGSVEAAQAVLGLTGEGAERFSQFLDEMGASAGATDAAFQQMNQGIGRAMDRLRAVMQNFFVNIGGLVSPMLTPLIKGFSDVVQVLANVIGGEFGIEALQDALMEVPAFFRPILRILFPLAAGFHQLATDLDPNNPNGFFGALNAGVPLFAVVITQLRRVMSAMGFSQEVIDGVSNALITAWNIIRTFINGLQTLLAPIVEWVRENIELKDVLIALGIAVAAFVIPAIVSLVAALAPVIATFALLVGAVALVRNAWERDWLGIKTFIEGQILPFFDGLWDAFQEGGFAEAGQFIKDEFAKIDWQAVGQTLLDGLGTALSLLISGAMWVNEHLVQPLVTTLHTAWDSIDWGEVGQSLLDALGTALTTLGTWAVWVYDNILVPLFDSGKQAVEDFDWYGLGEGIVNAIGTAIKTVFDFVAWIVDSIFNPVTEDSETASEQVDWGSVGTAILRGIGNFLRGTFNFVMWLFENVLTPLVLGAANAIAQVDWSGIGTGLMDAIKNALPNIFNWTMENIINPMIDGIRNFDLGAALRDVGNAVMGNERGISTGSFAGFPRQFGGAVAAGIPFRVGEAGPETFVPSTSGTILNAQDTEAMRGGNAPISIQFVFQRSISDNEAREAASKLKRELQAQGINVEGTF